MGDEGDETRAEGVLADEERKRKISEGMKRSHAKRKRQKTKPVLGAAAPAKKSPTLQRLIAERDALNVAITILERRGL
jgi:hypothetical protein